MGALKSSLKAKGYSTLNKMSNQIESNQVIGGEWYLLPVFLRSSTSGTLPARRGTSLLGPCTTGMPMVFSLYLMQQNPSLLLTYTLNGFPL